jgi:hypothetical protein
MYTVTFSNGRTSGEREFETLESAERKYEEVASDERTIEAQIVDNETGRSVKRWSVYKGEY